MEGIAGGEEERQEPTTNATREMTHVITTGPRAPLHYVRATSKFGVVYWRNHRRLRI